MAMRPMAVNRTMTPAVWQRPHLTLFVFALALLSAAGGCGENRSNEFKEFTKTEPKSTGEVRSQKNQTPPAKSSTNDVAPNPVSARRPAETIADSKVPEEGFFSTGDKTKPNASGLIKQKKPATKNPAPAIPIAALKPAAPVRKVEVLVKERKFRVEGPEDSLRVNFEDIDMLRVLNMEPVTPNALTLMPDWMKNLDGKRIKIRGFMLPEYEETGLRRFTIARDTQLCCYGRDPKPYDVFKVNIREGKSTRYIHMRPFDVVGVFHIRPDTKTWKVFGMYKIDDAVVIER